MMMGIGKIGRVVQVALAAMLLLTVAATRVVRADAPSVTIAAAANLEVVMTRRLIPEFTKETGIAVMPTYGATGLLAKQMEMAAPYDVFVSADTATVDQLVKERVLDGATEQPYAVGQLVLWARSDAPVLPKSIDDVTNALVTHIAVANPKTAPYGTGAIESLANAKLLNAVTSKIVYSANIQEALKFAQTGNADLAFTALSLVAADKSGVYVIIPAKLHAPIVQSVALRPSASDAAHKFEAFLLSKQAKPIWAAYGYLSPGR